MVGSQNEPTFHNYEMIGAFVLRELCTSHDPRFYESSSFCEWGFFYFIKNKYNCFIK